MIPDRVHFTDLQDLPVDGDRLRALLAFALEKHGVASALSLALVDDEKIAALNRRFADREGPTDVLAFPLFEPGLDDPDPELGEIVVSAETAARQAEDQGHGFEHEIALLALHGFLHLLGRDDRDPAEREAMLAEGEALLEAFEQGRDR
ncbi:MAG: rRNA maturation RNase YbeY [Planctomycetota bacterium]|jgi:probable rRNA maturation factor